MPDMKLQKTAIQVDSASHTHARCSMIRALTALRMITAGPAKTSVTMPVATVGSGW